MYRMSYPGVTQGNLPIRHQPRTPGDVNSSGSPSCLVGVPMGSHGQNKALRPCLRCPQ